MEQNDAFDSKRIKEQKDLQVTIDGIRVSNNSAQILKSDTRLMITK